MYLKRIDIFGFKSFAKSTCLEFTPGITAIVGPNGCGKSNVADALRWVMGLQAPKLLRSKRLEDIIFNGTKIHKPMGMCEVSISIGGDNGELITTPFGAFSEIVATRRLHRSGDSECFLNNIPCRLRDLTDMFLDVGIGSGYLEVIEQGRLSKVIDVSPEERRVVLEEAAGILKYKERRNEALRKLEISEQNLARVNDIIGELERQVRSLRRQGLRAERYRRYQDALRHLEVAILAADYRGLTTRLASLEERHRHTAAEEAALSAESATLENEVSLLRVAHMETEKALQARRTRQLQVEHEVDKHRGTIAHLLDRLGSLERETERSSHDIAQWGVELASVRQAAEELREESGACEAAVRNQVQLVEQCRARLEIAATELADTEKALREQKGAVIDALSDAAACRNALTAAQTRMEQAERAVNRLGAERAEEEKSRESSAARMEETIRTLGEHREALGRLSAKRERASARMEECLAELSNAEAARSALQATLAEKSSLLKSLEEVERNLVGIEEGPRAVLASRGSEGALQGVRSLVADVLETDPEYEVAIESALSFRLQALIVERPADGVDVVRFLKEHKLGRAECVPLQPREHFSNPTATNGVSGALALASDVVRTMQQYQQVVSHLLRNVFIVEDVASALSALDCNGAGDHTLVTLDGTVVQADGTVRGGAAGEHGMLKTKRMISLLRQEQGELREELQRWTSQIASLTDRKHEAEQQLKALAEEERGLERAILQSESEVDHVREVLQKAEGRQLALDLDEAALRHEVTECAKESERLERELLAKTRRRETIDKEVEQLQATLNSQASLVSALKDEIARHEIELTRMRATQERLASELSRLQRDEQDIQRRLAEREREREETGSTIIRLREEVETSQRSIAALSEELETIKGEVAGKEKELREQEAMMAERESVARSTRARLKELQEDLQQLLIERAGLDVQMDQLKRIAQETHQVILEDVLAEATGEGQDTDALREEARAVRSKLESMGNVNLAAQEEYNEVKERYTFLTKQRDDLTASIASLRQAIAQINRTTTARFAETFQAVNEQFQESCSRIFGGGEASLILTDPDNLLETGVDISVQPPGKRVKNISLLSVGEKVLASAALLFAVFRVKPSPFYFIDEMDAPLDEANARRFMELVKELACTSQFILITHNKATMSVSDTLYGITMEEEGVSKMISLHFNNGRNNASVPALAGQ